MTGPTRVSSAPLVSPSGRSDAPCASVSLRIRAVLWCIARGADERPSIPKCLSERVCGHARGVIGGLSGSLWVTKSGVDTLGYAGAARSRHFPRQSKGLVMTTPNPFNSEDQNSVPAPDAPSFPQASTPGYDQANAAPGAQQPVYGQPAYGQPSFGQPAFGQGAYATPPKQWIVALLLAFFVGYLGVHNFYLGYTTKGVIQLILSLTFFGLLITGIWAFVEFIMIIMRYGAYGCDAQGRPLE